MRNNIDELFGKNKLPEYISVVSASQCARIKIENIECIEQEGRKLHIITAEKDYAFYENMNTVIRSLAGRAFFRPMKGLIVNMDQIKDITGCNVNFYSGQCVAMGKNSISKMRAEYKRYLMKYPPYSLWEPAARVAEVDINNYDAVKWNEDKEKKGKKTIRD